MGDETRKANRRRANDPLFARVFHGLGIDIGCGGDRLGRDGLFPGIASCEGFDLSDGDAQDILRYKAASSFDFVYSSHCLEHIPDPARALQSWFALLRPSGYLILVVPDEDLYEQGNWPSRFNSDHKWTFTIHKARSWSPRSINLVDLVTNSLSGFSFIRISLVDDGYDYSITGSDQSSGAAEVGIELIIQKHDRTVAHPQGRVDLDRLLRSGEIPGNPENLAHRLPTVRRCVEVLQLAKRKTFVECGCQSTTLLHSQGMSTAIWAEVGRRSGAQLWTVDRSFDALKQCKLLTSCYDNIEYVLANSIEFLRTFERPIDFLYLDSLDFYDDCREEARQHQLREIEAAFDKLSLDAVVLLDDAHVQMWSPQPLDEVDIQGKTLLSHQFLLSHGAKCISDAPNYQRLYQIRRSRG